MLGGTPVDSSDCGSMRIPSPTSGSSTAGARAPVWPDNDARCACASSGPIDRSAIHDRRAASAPCTATDATIVRPCTPLIDANALRAPLYCVAWDSAAFIAIPCAAARCVPPRPLPRADQLRETSSTVERLHGEKTLAKRRCVFASVVRQRSSTRIPRSSATRRAVCIRNAGWHGLPRSGTGAR